MSNLSKSAALLGLALLSTAAAAAPPAEPLRTLSGEYVSAGAEDWGRGTFGRRDFTFADGHWTLRFVLALDPDFAHEVFAFRTGGSYRVTRPSPAVPGAFEADFHEGAKFVTQLTPDAKLAEAFGLAGCGLAVGVERDISGSGCALWRPVAVCAEDHDLLALDAAGGLRFGVRPADNDLCTPEKRPTALLPAVIRR